ncbi:GumC family protein [Cronbergia sp. UHCC 0137]|uniref:GumC family protein n=1 Tax=Cronbergia sp. UHCC 0137 TaxID=3110239 RepID=UPI002B21CBE8|nr:GumC family protein [Cronbergia sp. UHCC 0137]MEA5620187.1 GumC family protein [Cronbergia sp. UHCC 0137]
MIQRRSVDQVIQVKKVVNGRWLRYIILCILGNAFIWGSSLYYLKVTKPIYTSEWGLILSSGSLGVSVNLPGIGQASSSSGSALGSSTYDPRANLQYIFTSKRVLKAAAAIAKIPEDKFNKPRIKLLNNTTIMQFEVTGKSPEEARDKSLALYQAIVNHINVLRTGEISQRGKPSQQILLSAQRKLEDAQKRLSEYKIRSGLSFPDQVGNLSTNIEQLRRLRAETNAQEQLNNKRMQQLSKDLGLSPAEAATAFLLHADQIFQQNLKDYSEAKTTLEVLMTKFGVNHPQVIKEKNRQDAAWVALLQRSTYISGTPLTPATINRLALAVNGSGRDTLFQSLVSYQSDQQGLQAQVKGLDLAIAQLEERLDNLSQKQSILENLKRDQQIAEAVFASTLTKLDLGQGDVFSTYPLIQFAMEPSLPDEPTAPKKNFILVGAAVGSIFSTLGLSLLWIRKPWLKKLSKLIS